MAHRLRTKNGTDFYLFIKTAFSYPSDLVNTKTTIPLRVGEERWIYSSMLRASVYSDFNLRCRIKASSLQDKTEGEYGILMNNYQQN